MKKILLFGAGKSASVLIDYLLNRAPIEQWQITIVDVHEDVIQQKINGRPAGLAVGMDIKNEELRHQIIQDTDLVISLMPPALHILIAKDCVLLGKHLLTASYADKDMLELDKQAASKGMIILCEMGLDPGIDHMSAMEILDNIREQGGKITSFRSHCGGLVAPESDNNPWHYKISWNPRNVVNAGKQGADYLYEGKEIHEPYQALFDATRQVELEDEEVSSLAYYPNRNSLSYISLYQLEGVQDFIRTTLRYVDFMIGWKHLIDLKLTDDSHTYQVKDFSLQDFFAAHLNRIGFASWLKRELSVQLMSSLQLLQEIGSYDQERLTSMDKDTSFMILDEQGEWKNQSWSEDMYENISSLQERLHQASLLLEQLQCLGLNDDNTSLPFETATAADVLQFTLEKKLALQPGDKDMVVMLHEIGYLMNGEEKEIKSQLIVKGEDSIRTAMAKTVGLPLGIAAKLILEGSIKLSGVQIPTSKAIYLPVLEALKEEGILFKEKIVH